ncbi:MAG: hypothetical protein K2X29_01470 [Candidatus Obscuribacterales bacterium]|nr:hypothetical protein [Candidatus Obscuribacterales bacterium]
MSFILTDSEYELAKRSFSKLSSQLVKQSQKFKRDGVGRKERKRLMTPDMRKLKAARRDLALYEDLKDGKLPKNLEFIGLGRQLVYLRIANGLSQVELAAQLGEEARKVDSDERTEYQSASVAYVQRVLSALRARVRLTAKLPNPSKQSKK